MPRTDFACRHFPDDEGRDDTRKVGLFTTKQSDAAASPRTSYPELHTFLTSALVASGWLVSRPRRFILYPLRPVGSTASLYAS
jgi:hypothetical protein